MQKLLKFIVRHQQMRMVDTTPWEVPVEASTEYLQALFDFQTEEWSGLTKIAYFKGRDNKTYNVEIVDGVCTVPWETITKSGYITVSVAGFNGKERKTASRVRVFIDGTGYLSETENTQEPTPSVLDEMVAKISNAEDAVQRAEVAASTAMTEADRATQAAENAAVSEKNAADAASKADGIAKNLDVGISVENGQLCFDQNTIPKGVLTDETGKQIAEALEASGDGLTDEQYDALNSGISATKIAKYDAGMIPAYTFADLAITQTTGKVIKTDGSEYSLGVGKYAVAKINYHTELLITGYVWAGSQFPLVLLRDKDGNVLKTFRPTDKGTNVLYKDYSIDTSDERIFDAVVNSKNTDSKEVYIKEESPVPMQTIYDATVQTKTWKPKYKLILMGDSITALGSTWGTPERAWWYWMSKSLSVDIIVNTAVNNARLSDMEGTEYDGAPVSANATNNVLGNQVQKLLNGSYEAPDYIMIAIGTNNGVSITTDDMVAATTGDVDTIDRKVDANAFWYCYQKLHKLYPEATIVWCTPIHGSRSVRFPEKIMAYGDSLKLATGFVGTPCIDSMRCGISSPNYSEYLTDKLHPNEKGAKMLGRYNAGQLRTLFDIEID